LIIDLVPQPVDVPFPGRCLLSESLKLLVSGIGLLLHCCRKVVLRCLRDVSFLSEISDALVAILQFVGVAAAQAVPLPVGQLILCRVRLQFRRPSSALGVELRLQAFYPDSEDISVVFCRLGLLRQFLDLRLSLGELLLQFVALLLHPVRSGRLGVDLPLKGALGGDRLADLLLELGGSGLRVRRALGKLLDNGLRPL
jgi:hypothetical protein